MQIKVTCPECSTDYHLDRAMIGKHMRCPNSLCGAIFEVRDANEPAPATEPTAEEAPPETVDEPKSKHVGDLVPILSTEPVETEPPAATEQPPAQPPIQDDIVPILPSEPVATEPTTIEEPADDAAAKIEKPTEEATPDWASAPPPVREKSDDSPALADTETLAPDPDLDDLLFPSEAADVSNEADDAALLGIARPKRAKRRARWIIVGLVLLMAGGVSAAWWSIRQETSGDEEQRYKQAVSLFERGDYAESVVRFQKLHRDFPQSTRQQEYRMLAELSDVLDPVYQSQETAEETAKSLGRFLQFLKLHEGEAAFKLHRVVAWDVLHRLHKELLRWAKDNRDRDLLQLSQRALAEAKQYPAPERINPHQKYREAEKAFAALESALAKTENRNHMLDRLKEYAEQPTAADVIVARRLVREAKLEKDPAFQKALTQIKIAHQAAVVYLRNDDEAPSSYEIDDVPSLLITPLHGELARNLPSSNRVVLALSRGLLLGLAPKNSDVLWARRVGVDTTELPLRLPPTDVAPELLLVLSSDRRSISALESANGSAVWTTPLSDVCLCNPVLVQDRVFVPTYDGRVDEIEIGHGRKLGYYDVGQTVSAGAVHQPNSPFLYVAADEYCVYVLDVVKRACTAVLYTNHPSASLRTPPFIIQNPGLDETGKSTAHSDAVLLLFQADGSGGTETRLFQLPIRDPDQPQLDWKMRMRGWTWFPPYSDGERLAMVTDAGEFHLLGVRQKGNVDPRLFPLVDALQIGVTRRSMGRAQIALVAEDDFWVLAHRRLHRLQSVFKDKTGPQLLDRWRISPVLGDPLHAGQALNGRGGPVLFLATRDAKDGLSWASAVHGDSGKLLWKRQLGWLPENDPIVWNSAVWGHDHRGFYRFPFDVKKGAGTSLWLSGKYDWFPRKGAFRRTDWLVDDSADSIVVAAEEAAKKGYVLQLQSFDKQGQIGKSGQVLLPSSLAGRPARAGGILVAPLADGALRRIELEQNSSTPGPGWRSTEAAPNANAYIVPVGDAEFLVSDGHSGLQRLHWPQPNRWEKKGEHKLTFSIVSAPIVLGGKTGEPMRVCVADATNTVHLLDGERFRPVRTWRMPGVITGGPFDMDGAIAVVVRNRRLVWLDPNRNEPAWEYTFLADVVGKPLAMNGEVVLATAAGKFVALTKNDGRLTGWEYLIRSNLEPAAAPVIYGDEQLFAPLSDGTVMLIPFRK